MRALPAKALLPNILKGSKTFGATFTPDGPIPAVVGESTPLITYDPDGLLPVIISQSVSAAVAVNLTLSRPLVALKIWAQKTGADGVGGETVIISQGVFGSDLCTLNMNVVNGTIVEPTVVLPEFINFDPATAIGSILLTPAFPAGSGCIVYILCQRYGNV